MPAAGGPREPRLATRDGYSLLEWTDGGRMFVAVSDLPPAELIAFGAASGGQRRPNAKRRQSHDVASRGPETLPSAKRFGSLDAPSPQRFISPFIAVGQCAVEDP